MKARCTCPETQEFDGRVYPVMLDPDCPQHSFPRDDWPASHPLRRHAQHVEDVRATATYIALFGEPPKRPCTRLETPREVTRRLMETSA